MEKKQLYIKNPNGRYEPYREPEPPYDNCLYRKVGKRYEPCSMLMTNDLGEGVWVVTKHPYGRRITSGMYLRDMFMCQKASDIQDIPLSTLGAMDKLAEHLSRHYDELPKNVSQADLCRAIVGLLFKYENERDNGK